MAALKIAAKIVGSAGSACCCPPPPDCCFYPADQFGILYFASDLPAALTIKTTDTTLHSVSLDASVPGTPRYKIEGVLDLYFNSLPNPGWRYNDADMGETFATNSCLITGDGNFVPGDNLVEDQFPAELSSDFDGAGGSPPVTDAGPLIRQALCWWKWEGGNSYYDEETGTTYWDTLFLEYDDVSTKWYVQFYSSVGVSFFWIKSGNQDSPLGLYEEGPGSLYGASVTIS